MSVLSRILTVAFIGASAASSFGQCKEWKWPEDGALKAKAEEQVSLYTDYSKNKEYKKAASHLQWVLTTLPNLNTSIYINGTEIYDELAKAEKDPARKKVYVDSLMIIYDMRIKNCGEEATVLNRKVFDFAKYYGTTDRSPEVLAMFDKVYELNGNNVIDQTGLPYMQILQYNKLKFKKLTDAEVMDRYDRINTVFDAKIKKHLSEGKKEQAEKIQKAKKQVEEILLKTITIDCNFVKTNFAPKFEQNPADLELAKKIFQFMTIGGCFEDPLWLSAAEVVHKNDPNYTLVKNMGKLYAKKDNFPKAEECFNEAAKLASSKEEQVESNMLLGDLAAQRGNKPAARMYYRKALDIDPTVKDAYEKIGDLYMASFSECAKKTSYAEDRLVYIAAYEMYARAGASGKMAQAKSNFPSNTELFEVNWNEGDSKRVECWIGETVVLKTRGKE